MRSAACLILALVSLAPAGYDPLSIGGEWLIDSYKLVISPLQGQRMCNFWPTCSQFARGAIRSEGFLPGTMIGAERLMRCHNFAWSGYDKHYFGISHDRLNDPVDAHIAWREPASVSPGGTVLAIRPEDLPLDLPTDAPTRSELDFADYLYSGEDYARAAREYSRLSFQDPRAEVRAYAALMAGEAFLRSGELSQAGRAFCDARGTGYLDEAAMGIARVRFAAGRYAEVESSLATLVTDALTSRRVALAGWSQLRQYRFADAAATFRASGDDRLSVLAGLDGSDLPLRSRALSTTLSAIVPGAGQIYSGRVGDGLYALLTVAGSGFLTYWFAADPERRDRTRIKVSVFGAVTALFYAAGIYGANIAARDYNRYQQRRYLARFEPILSKIELAPDYSGIMPGSPGTPADSD